jgi:hypothetical protein
MHPPTRMAPIRTALALLAVAAMTVGLAQPAAAADPAPFHFIRGSATTSPGSVCVDSYVEPASGVVGVTLDIAVNGVPRDSVTSTLTTSRRVPFTDPIDYSRCFDVPAGPAAVTAAATANPDHTGGRPLIVPVLSTTLQVAEVTPPTVPAAPRKPSVQAGGAAAMRVGWAAVDDGGSDITGYEVRVSKAGAVIRTLSTPAASMTVSGLKPHSSYSVTVSGLKPHSSYSVTVRARNAVGVSPASSASSLKLQAPGRPAAPAVSPTSATSAKVVWKSPKSAGGPAVTGYQVRVYRGSRVVQTVDVAPGTRSATVTGLEGRTGYGVVVRAKNGVGFSASSARSSVTTKDWSAASKWAAKKYGTFTTVTITGAGNDVIALPKGAKAGILTATHSGSSAFALEVQGRNGTTIDRAVNRVGAYTGSTLFGMDSWRGTPRQLKISASGDWTIRISAVRTAESLPSSGKGDGVHLYGGSTKRLAVTHSGTRSFTVYTYASGTSGRNHLVNGYGAYRGEVPITKGPAVVEVVADGSWTARLR